MRDLVLRYYEMGPEFGYPLSWLEHRCTNMSVVAKIVRGKLLLCHSSQWYVEAGKSIQTEVYDIPTLFCGHTRTHLSTIVMCAINHVANGSPQRNMKCSRLVKCAYCATDIRIAIEQVPEGYLVHIDAWQNWGSRHSKGVEGKMFGTSMSYSSRRTPRELSAARLQDIQSQFLEEEHVARAADVIILQDYWARPEWGVSTSDTIPDGSSQDWPF